jgi:Protein of unknown function (DUF3300)
MKLERIAAVLMGIMFLLAGRLSAQEVKTDYDRNANFAQYKTYSWETVKTKDTLDSIESRTLADALVAQLLAASTYPTEIVEADRWTQSHTNLKGEALAKKPTNSRGIQV